MLLLIDGERLVRGHGLAYALSIAGMPHRSFRPCDCGLCRQPPPPYYLAALALFALTACVQPRELTARERAFIHAAPQAWAEIGQPPLNNCDWSATTIRIGSCGPKVAGCVVYELAHPLRGLRHPAITIGPAFVADDKLLAHELTHALDFCAGSPVPGSIDHTSKVLWQDQGGASSVQARIRALAVTGASGR